MQCVISQHNKLLGSEAITVYLGNALCEKHLYDAKRFINRCKNPNKVSSYSVIDVLESQEEYGS